MNKGNSQLVSPPRIPKEFTFSNRCLTLNQESSMIMVIFTLQFPSRQPNPSQTNPSIRTRRGMIWKGVNPRKCFSRRTQAQGGPKGEPVVAKEAQAGATRDTAAAHHPHSDAACHHEGLLTPLAGSAPVAGARAVADEAVPAIFAHGVVLAGVAVTLLSAHP